MDYFIFQKIFRNKIPINIAINQPTFTDELQCPVLDAYVCYSTEVIGRAEGAGVIIIVAADNTL